MLFTACILSVCGTGLPAVWAYAIADESDAEIADDYSAGELYFINDFDQAASLDGLARIGDKLLVLYTRRNVDTEGEVSDKAAADYNDGNLAESDTRAFIALVDPDRQTVISSIDLGQGQLDADSIIINDHNEICAANLDTNEIVRLNESLELIASFETSAQVNKIRFSGDGKYAYYFDTVERKAYELDLETGEKQEIFGQTQENFLTIKYVSDRGEFFTEIYGSDDKTHTLCLNRDGEKIKEIIAADISEAARFNGDLYYIANYGSELYRQSTGTCETCSDGQNSAGMIEETSELYEYYYNGIQSKYMLDPKNGIAVNVHFENKESTDQIICSVYNLESGCKIYEATIPIPKEQQSRNYDVDACFLPETNQLAVMFSNDGKGGIVIWNLDTAKKQNSSSAYISTAVSMEDMQKKADEISEKYDVSVYVGDYAGFIYNGSYQFDICQDAYRTYKFLQILDDALSRYPDGFFTQIRSLYGKRLHYFAVDKIYDMNSDGILTLYLADGLSFWMQDADQSRYQAIAVNITKLPGGERTIYHETFHAVDRYLWDQGIFCDEEWERLNPDDFSYEDNFAGMENFSYLLGMTDSDNVYFTDSYAKANIDEDRARIMEYAMSPFSEDREAIEDNVHLLAKLKCLSKEIRMYFDTTGWPEKTAWEIWN